MYEECALLQAATPMAQAAALLQMFAAIKLAEEMRKVWVHSSGSGGSQQWILWLSTNNIYSISTLISTNIY